MSIDAVEDAALLKAWLKSKTISIILHKNKNKAIYFTFSFFLRQHPGNCGQSFANAMSQMAPLWSRSKGVH